MAKDNKETQGTEKKRSKGYFWYIPEEDLVKTILIALDSGLTAKEFRDILETNTRNHPANNRIDKPVHPLSLAQAQSKFRQFKKHYDYPHISLKRDKLTKKEEHQQLQQELKDKYDPDFRKHNKKKS